mgnify:FL=1
MTFAVDHLENGFALVSLSAAARRNAFSTDSMQSMAEIFDGLLDDPSVRAIVMTGTGKFFCAGADIDEFASSIDDGTIGEVVKNLTGILPPLELRIRGSETVFIAAINGAAAGGGLGLALVADYRVCVPQAKLAPAFFSLGLSPDGGTTWLLPRLVGSQRAKRFFFDNKPWTGEQALEFGAVDELVDSTDLVERAVTIAAKWGSWAEMSRRSTKQLLDASTSTFMETQLEFERALITASSLTPDFAEGVTAFLEKRKPVFGVFEEE